MKQWMDAIQAGVTRAQEEEQRVRQLQQEQRERREAIQRQVVEMGVEAATAASAIQLGGEEKDSGAAAGADGLSLAEYTDSNGDGRSRFVYDVPQLPQPALDVTASRSTWAHLDQYSLSEDEWQRLKEVSGQVHKTPYS